MTRVMAGTHPSPPHVQQLPARRAHPAYLRLREALREQPAPFEWAQFRRLALAMFGKEALAPARKGREGRNLSLNGAQVRKLASHPLGIRETIQKLQAKGRLPKDKPGWTAAKAAELYSSSAHAALGKQGRKKLHDGTFTVATVNDNFNSPKSNLPHVKADVLLAQEAKAVNAHKALSDEYGVHQNVHRKDQQGSAVAWDKDRVKAVKSGYAMGVAPHGAGMLTRWINYTDVKVDGVKVRMVSVHRPPKRFKRLWPLFDANLARFVKQSKLPIVVGLDANERHPAALARKTGLKWSAPKGSIDGFLVSEGIHVEKTWRLPKGSSDHHPVMAKLRLSAKLRERAARD